MKELQAGPPNFLGRHYLADLPSRLQKEFADPAAQTTGESLECGLLYQAGRRLGDSPCGLCYPARSGVRIESKLRAEARKAARAQPR